MFWWANVSHIEYIWDGFYIQLYVWQWNKQNKTVCTSFFHKQVTLCLINGFVHPADRIMRYHRALLPSKGAIGFVKDPTEHDSNGSYATRALRDMTWSQSHYNVGYWWLHKKYPQYFREIFLNLSHLLTVSVRWIYFCQLQSPMGPWVWVRIDHILWRHHDVTRGNSAITVPLTNRSGVPILWGFVRLLPWGFLGFLG